MTEFSFFLANGPFNVLAVFRDSENLERDWVSHTLERFQHPDWMMLFSFCTAGRGSASDTLLRDQFTSQDDKGLITQGSTQNGR